MNITKVYQSGNSQAVRIPKEFRFRAEEVEIFKRGDEIILREKKGNLSELFYLLASLSDDFMAEGRQQLPIQKRESF